MDSGYAREMPFRERHACRVTTVALAAAPQLAAKCLCLALSRDPLCIPDRDTPQVCCRAAATRVRELR